MKIVEEEEEEVAEIQPDPLHQLILHFSHNALTERRYIFTLHVSFWQVRREDVYLNVLLVAF